MEAGREVRVALWWIGQGTEDEQGMEQARALLSEEYGVTVVRGRLSGWPANAWDERRGQHCSTRVLEWLAAERPPRTHKVLGVTDRDLFIPVLTYVFGEAQLGGAAAVVSVARLRQAPLGLGSRRLARSRLVKECAHELGHAFGLVHCAIKGCVMGRAVSAADVDAKNAGLCPACRQKVHALQQRGQE